MLHESRHWTFRTMLIITIIIIIIIIIIVVVVVLLSMNVFDYLDLKFWHICICNLMMVHVAPKRSSLILTFIVKFTSVSNLIETIHYICF